MPCERENITREDSSFGEIEFSMTKLVATVPFDATKVIVAYSRRSLKVFAIDTSSTVHLSGLSQYEFCLVGNFFLRATMTLFLQLKNI